MWKSRSIRFSCPLRNKTNNILKIQENVNIIENLKTQGLEDNIEVESIYDKEEIDNINIYSIESIKYSDDQDRRG